MNRVAAQPIAAFGSDYIVHTLLLLWQCGAFWPQQPDIALLLHVPCDLPGLGAGTDKEVGPHFAGNGAPGVLRSYRANDGVAVSLGRGQPEQTAQRDDFAIHRHAVARRQWTIQ